MKRMIIITILSFSLMACNDNKPKTLISAGQAVQIDASSAECPYLTKDSKGHTVLSWVRIINDSTTAFCYATSMDGKTFSSPKVIPNSDNIQPHGENLPKIIFKPSGEIIALWGASNRNPNNKYAGQVFYTQSFDEGKNWTIARPLVSDTASHDQRYYDVNLLPNGEVGIIWLDNRKSTSKEGSALYFASTNGIKGFEGGKLISQPCCQCCRTDLYVDKKGNIHALFRGIIQDSIRDMVHIVSTDGGKAFSAPKRISEDNWVINGCPHTGPAMTENNNGIHFAWFTGGKNRGCFYTKSSDNGKSFVMHDSISALGSHPQLTSLASGELLIAWDETRAVDNKVSKQIGIQRRSADGKSEGKEFITPNDYQASYPVIAASGEHSSIVAYTVRKGEKHFVSYQVIFN
ncbi:MAG TPA: sialidase family protein [Chitinophagaceae bacterium]|jgi:hypothetical protein|nr:sialidase family protein [Chitinophagaceae bacterium]